MLADQLALLCFWCSQHSNQQLGNTWTQGAMFVLLVSVSVIVALNHCALTRQCPNFTDFLPSRDYLVRLDMTKREMGYLLM